MAVRIENLPYSRYYLALVGYVWLLLSCNILSAADHSDGPLISDDPRADVGDVYVFTSPENSNNTVLIMTIPIEGALFDTFSSDLSYQFMLGEDNPPPLCGRCVPSDRTRYGRNNLLDFACYAG